MDSTCTTPLALSNAACRAASDCDINGVRETRSGLSRRRGKRLRSKPGLNFPFADRLVLVLVRITIQNGNSG
jgi:hypothetical protein